MEEWILWFLGNQLVVLKKPKNTNVAYRCRAVMMVQCSSSNYTWTDNRKFYGFACESASMNCKPWRRPTHHGCINPWWWEMRNGTKRRRTGLQSGEVQAMCPSESPIVPHCIQNARRGRLFDANPDDIDPSMISSSCWDDAHLNPKKSRIIPVVPSCWLIYKQHLQIGRGN